MRYVVLSLFVLFAADHAHADNYIQVKQTPFYPGPKAPSQLLANLKLTTCCGDDDPEVARVYRLANKVRASGWEDLIAIHSAYTTIEVSYQGKVVKLTYGGAALDDVILKRWNALLKEIQRLAQERLSVAEATPTEAAAPR